MLEFTPPSSNDVVQMLQYLQWVQTLVPLQQLRAASPSASSRRTTAHQRTHSKPLTKLKEAQYLCDQFRSGEKWLELLAALQASSRLHTQRHEGSLLHDSLVPPSRRTTRKNGTTSPRKGKDDTAQTLRTLQQAHKELHRFLDVDASDLPSEQELYSGRMESIGKGLFHIFHQVVVRDRFALFDNMLQWYHDVAAMFSRDHLVDASLDFLRDGTLWVLLFYAMSEISLSMDTVFEWPKQHRERVANVSFAFSLFDAYSVFNYFDSVDAFVDGCSRHFLFMQAFMVFQRFCGTTRFSTGHVVDTTAIRFAEPLIEPPATAAADVAEPALVSPTRIRNPMPCSTSAVKKDFYKAAPQPGASGSSTYERVLSAKLRVRTTPNRTRAPQQNKKRPVQQPAHHATPAWSALQPEERKKQQPPAKTAYNHYTTSPSIYA